MCSTNENRCGHITSLLSQKQKNLMTFRSIYFSNRICRFLDDSIPLKLPCRVGLHKTNSSVQARQTLSSPLEVLINSSHRPYTNKIFRSRVLENGEPSLELCHFSGNCETLRHATTAILLSSLTARPMIGRVWSSQVQSNTALKLGKRGVLNHSQKCLSKLRLVCLV